MILIFLLNLLYSAGAYDKLDKINILYVGESRVIDGTGIKKVTVANSRIIKVSRSGSKDLSISARRKGSSDIKIWNKKGEISGYSFTVISAEVYQRLGAVRQALSGVKGVRVANAGDYIYITGLIENAEEQDLVNKVVSSHSGVMNYAKTSASLQGQRIRAVTAELFDLGLYDISVSEVAGIMYIKGSVRSREQLDNVTHHIKTRYADAVPDIAVVPYQVDIDVKIMEVSGSLSGKLGFDIPTQYNVTRHTVFSRIEIDSVLNLEKQKGRIRILANPSLSANDSEKAVFHAGGELPIRLSSRFSSSVEWKNYGVMLNFIPRVINDNTVKLNIESEFSSMDGISGQGDIPSFSVRRVSTVVTVDSNKSVLISGLIHKMSSRGNSGLPVLSEVPVISDIFSLNESSNSDSELAIMVTPSIRFRCEGFMLDRELEELLVEALGEEVKRE
ncbi:MAG: pilus assembly protein N-terminal domain-containing protein [Oligoflexia bacterium]|nr:pilus assembly protein N-terminal domain-containing protein [Oligoflexia bacterium]